MPAEENRTPETPVPEAAAAPGRDDDYWQAEARRAFARRDEARQELAAARELAERAAAEAAAGQRLIQELLERKLQQLPARARKLVPETLPAPDRLRYLIENETLLCPPPVAAVPGPEKPSGQQIPERAFEDMSYAELTALYRADPERYRRAAEASRRRRR